MPREAQLQSAVEVEREAALEGDGAQEARDHDGPRRQGEPARLGVVVRAQVEDPPAGGGLGDVGEDERGGQVERRRRAEHDEELDEGPPLVGAQLEHGPPRLHVD
jgi:hypothetical protein